MMLSVHRVQDDRALKELQEQKVKMEMELKNLEANLKTVKWVTPTCAHALLGGCDIVLSSV
jgi:hypothetical protein